MESRAVEVDVGDGLFQPHASSARLIPASIPNWRNTLRRDCRLKQNCCKSIKTLFRSMDEASVDRPDEQDDLKMSTVICYLHRPYQRSAQSVMPEDDTHSLLLCSDQQ